MSKVTFFQAKRGRHCLSSSSVLGAGSLYVVSLTIIQVVSRGLACRSPFTISLQIHTMSACAAPFYLQGFLTFFGHISSHRCA